MPEMGTEPTPVEVTPRFTNTRAQNLALVKEQLLAAGLIAQADQFTKEYEALTASHLRRDMEDHPVTAAAVAVGVKVRWVS